MLEINGASLYVIVRSRSFPTICHTLNIRFRNFQYLYQNFTQKTFIKLTGVTREKVNWCDGQDNIVTMSNKVDESEVSKLRNKNTKDELQ